MVLATELLLLISARADATEMTLPEIGSPEGVTDAFGCLMLEYPCPPRESRTQSRG